MYEYGNSIFSGVSLEEEGEHQAEKPSCGTKLEDSSRSEAGKRSGQFPPLSLGLPLPLRFDPLYKWRQEKF